jgi:phospholipid/cholesterol/gamma-HCH transport system ATP-binding protein
MIEIRSLKKNLGGNQVLDGVDLMVDEGECVVVMGPSGTGKSVLLKHIVGLFDPDEGDVLVDGVSVSRADGRTIKRIRSRISYVFQNSALFDSLTVEGNILLGLPEGHSRGARARQPRPGGASASPGRALRWNAEARRTGARGGRTPAVHPVR